MSRRLNSISSHRCCSFDQLSSANWFVRNPRWLLQLIVCVNVTSLLCLIYTWGFHQISREHLTDVSSLLNVPQPLSRSTKSDEPNGTRTEIDFGQRKELAILVWNTKNDMWNQVVDLRGSSAEESSDSMATKKCVFTIDKTRFNSSTGVLFYGDLMHLSTFPAGPRIPGQKWIYLSVETPVNTVNTGVKQVRLQRQKHMYNVTSTYSMTSDVPLPYFSGTCRLRPNVDNEPHVRSEIGHVIAAKRRLAAWFVSHCQTNSRREKYVEELRKHVEVDVFGACGTLNCSRTIANFSDNYYDACDDMVSRVYKFYLAFENSLCADYVTEKFFRFLRRDVVAVALGAANYTQFVPRDTYIDVRDFRSPKQLAERLQQLDSDDELYAEYLLRKRRVQCRELWKERHEERLCRHLWDNLNTTERADLSTSLNGRKVCLTPRTFYRGIADSLK